VRYRQVPGLTYPLWSLIGTFTRGHLIAPDRRAWNPVPRCPCARRHHADEPRTGRLGPPSLRDDLRHRADRTHQNPSAL